MKVLLKNKMRTAAVVLLTFISTLPTAVALDCKDVVGTWKGDLGNIKGVKLMIAEKIFSADMKGEISFKDKFGERTLDFGEGTCGIQPDGQAVVTLNHVASDITGHFTGRLNKEGVLAGDMGYIQLSPPFNRNEGSGELKK